MSAWTRIAHTELGSAANNITFSSIPATYTDLYLVLSLRTTTTKTDGWDDTQLEFNGSTSGITARQLYGIGSGSGASNTSSAGGVFANHASMTSNTFASAGLYLANYQSTTNKSYSVESITEQNATSAIQVIAAGLITSSAAITSLAVKTVGAVNFVQYSSATLYGITKGSSGGVTVS